jgi:hypothetical protein
MLFLAAGPALAYDDGGDQGSGNDQRRCYHAENCRGSFSPGPFDRSPVDVHDNQICISPDCSGRDDGKKQPPQDQQPQGIACLVPFPYHCDERPKEMITDPAKLVKFPFTIAEMSFDFAQRILKLVV